jgi:hypothetical protein
MWSFFKKEQPKTLEINADIKLVKEVNTSAFRSGMWIVSDNRVGILHKLQGVDAEVHYVDVATGDTVVIINTTIDNLRQAKYTEIPLVRRGIDLQTAKRLGYGN